MLTTPEKIGIAVAITNGLVAVGTGVLAWKTRSMARATEQMAEATQDEAKAVAQQTEKVAAQVAASEAQARISAEALEASIQPWLTRTVPLHMQGDVEVVREEADTRVMVFVWLRNVGSGIALITPDGCEVTGGGITPGQAVRRIGHVNQPALPPGEVARIGFRIEGPDVRADPFLDRRDSWGQFRVSIPYTDASGGQAVRAEILIAGNQSGTEWRMVGIDYVRPPDQSPFASVKFDAALG